MEGNDVSRAVDRLLNLSDDALEADEPYQASFAGEGERKAGYIIDDLVRREATGQLRTTELGYLCVGGADGSEVLEVLRSTGLRRAVMIEISDAGAAMARDVAHELLKRTGKQIHVVQGDATGRLPDALDILEGWLASGAISGLALSAQAVLHELPRRSPGFDLADFLGMAFRHPDWDACVFYSREPCEPAGWPARVRIRIPGVSGKRLAEAARYIGQRLQIDGADEVAVLASAWVSLSSVLAIETLHKLIRGTGIRRIRYELGEQLTGLNALDIKRHLEALVAGMTAEVDLIVTRGFKQALQDNRVEYLSSESQPLTIPRTHAEVIGVRPSTQQRTAAESHSRALHPPRETIDLESIVDRFNGAFSEAHLLAWLAQFEPREIRFIEPLLRHFVFVSAQGLKESLVDLGGFVRVVLGTAFDDALFVPIGGVARSGDFIAYQFRSQNALSVEQFRHVGDLMPDEVAERPLVFLDDVLASGHQAVDEWHHLSNSFDVGDAAPRIVATVASCAAGRDYLEERTELLHCSAVALTREAEPLSPESSIYANDEERFAATEVLRSYGERLAPMAPLGYAGTGVLLGFEHNTPDNTFPIFWSNAGGWLPLVRLGGTTRVLVR